MARHWRSGHGKPDYRVRAVSRVCDLFDALQGAVDGVTIDSVVRSTGMSKPTLLRYLATLEARRYAERNPATGSYRLGGAFLPVRALHLDVLMQRARRHLEEVCAQLAETVTLGLLDGGHVIYLDVAESPSSLRVSQRRGEREPLHASALGKAIAAELADVRVRDLLEAGGMPRYTDRTITSPQRYLAELEEVRGRGWAVEDGEHEPGIGGVAVALPGDRFVAGLGVSAPADRLSPHRAENIADVLEHHVRALARLNSHR
jgi:IclR family acetate operon transcriptional repressor